MGNVIFVVIFVIFCAFLLGAGLISKRWVKESSDFVLAGREISTPINVVGVIAIGFAGTTVTLAPGFTIQYGLLGGLGWGVIYSVCGMATMAVFTLLDLTKVFSINSYVYLATLGLVVTLVVAVIASLFGQPKYYGRPGWERVPTASNRKEVKLGELEKQILEMLRIGHCYMSDLTDALGVDSKTSGAAVENLDQGGYLVRAGMSGSKFYTFTITEKGLAALPALSGKEAEMAEEFLNPLYVQLLKVVKENPEQQAEFVQKNGIKSMRMSAICSHLTRRGYVVEGGLFKRKLRITEKGAAALQKYA